LPRIAITAAKRRRVMVQDENCGASAKGVTGTVKERRQVHDLPEVRLLVREHQVEEVCCPRCQQVSAGSFPVGVEAPGQYGPNLRALAVYLHQYQLVPLARACELLCDLCDCQISQGTLTAWVELAAQTLEPTIAYIAACISASRVQHGDETGILVRGKLRLPARQQHTLADPPDLARQARQEGVGSDRHPATLSWAGHA
jgi:transposase